MTSSSIIVTMTINMSASRAHAIIIIAAIVVVVISISGIVYIINIITVDMMCGIVMAIFMI